MQNTIHLESKWEDYAITLHKDCIGPLQNLLKEAKIAGFRPRVISAYRSIEHQKRIWNNKLSGKTAVMDFTGNTKLNTTSLTPHELIMSIARWSAFPGFSRHHWGTDFDIVDETYFKSIRDIQLIPKESDGYPICGPNFAFSLWLWNYSLNHPDIISFPYYNPGINYSDYFKIGPEPWHISFKQVVEKYNFQQSYNKNYWNSLVRDYSAWGMFSSAIHDLSEELFALY